MPLRILLLLLLALPVLDLWSLGWAIEQAGLGPTLLAILVSGLVGFSTARRGAFLVLRQLSGMDSEGDARQGLLLLLAAGLLAFPGVISDGVALPFLIGPLRRWIAPRLLSGLAIHSLPGGVGFGLPRGAPQGPRVKVGEPSQTAPRSRVPARENPFSTPFD